MSTRSLIILTLVICAVAFGITQFGVQPILRGQHETHQASQLNPLTNDFGKLVRFKSRYMGNASNDGNLNSNLPLADIPHTYELHPRKLELVINYRLPAKKIGEAKLRPALIYNAAANFALIDNLQSIVFHFPDVSYHVTKQREQAWYGVKPTRLSTVSAWNSHVKNGLRDQTYVNNAFASLFDTVNNAS